MDKMKIVCPLCGAKKTELYLKDRKRSYYSCSRCALIFVPELFLLNGDEEKARYDLHINHRDDPGYREFLSRFSKPLIASLPPGAEGLDFGCGPGPVLAEMLESAGHSIDLFDLYYHPYDAVFTQTYDFITATEVVEHLAQPWTELERLWSMLKPGGLLAIMTQIPPEQSDFNSWYYKADPTHITFFSHKSLEWIAGELGTVVEIKDKDVFFFRKQA